MSARILQVFNRYLERGGEEIWVEEFERLAAEDHQLFTLYFNSSDWREGSPLTRVRQVFQTWNHPASRDQFRMAAKAHHAEFLLFHNILPVGSFGLYQEAKDLSLPVLQYTHNFRPFSPSGTMWVDDKVIPDVMEGSMIREVCGGAWGGSRIKTALMAFYMKRFINSGLIGQVAHWLAISDFMRTTFIKAGIPKERITTLRHCRTISEEVPDERDDGYYLFLGRLVPEKGCFTLLDSWKLLEEETGGRCPNLVIAGTGPIEDSLKRHAGDSEKIRFSGFVAGVEKKDLLAGCRALIAPSIWWEPLGLIALDGFEYAKPVLASDSGGLTELIVDSGGGLLHQPGDSASLEKDIRRIEGMTPNERREIGVRGREWLKSEGSPERWRERLDQILERLK